MRGYNLNHLQELESESIYVIREVAAQFEKPVILFSGGKDSIVCAHLAKKAFFPAKMPFTLLHVDTGHNFEETLNFRDYYVQEMGVNLIVASVQNAIDSGLAMEEKGLNASRNGIQTIALLKAIEDHGLDAALGGARRDEEKARAKERFFSHRDEFGQWDPKNQRPELWNIFNGMKQYGESFRIFPISNWTEMDVWQYILNENLELPSLYFSHARNCFNRNGTLMYASEVIQRKPEETVEKAMVRYRTIGDITCTGAIYSTADTVEKVINEIAASKITERGSRSDDRRTEAAMEDRKKQGYF